MKKWSFLNLFMFILLWLTIICSYYVFHYPQDFEITTILRLVEWKPLLLLYLALLLVSFIFGIIYSKKKSFYKVFVKAAFILQCLATLFFIILCIYSFTIIKRQYSQIIIETKERAAQDIKNDSIVYISYGLPLLDSNYLKKDSIMAKYGVYVTFQCIMDNFSLKQEELYKQLTKKYLEKRNGKDWEEKMQKELVSFLNK